VTPSSLCGDDGVEGDMVSEVRSLHHLFVVVMLLRGIWFMK